MDSVATVAGRGKGPIPSLDGIRAIAVLIVFFAHNGLDEEIPGGLGVTIFFVLSGYLISTLMRIEHADTGALNYRMFYARRLLRLMPPLVIVVVAAGAASALGIIDGRFEPFGLLAALFYAGNYYVIANDYHGMPAGLPVLWSLAVEEHYYLFYPPLAALLLRIGRVGLSVRLLAILCGLVLLWRCWLALQGVPEAYLSMATDTRVDAILVGCLMALGRNPWLDSEVPRNQLRDLGIAAACIAALIGSLAYRSEFFRMTLRYTVQSIAIAPLIWLAVARARHAPFRWLNGRVLGYIGTISYSIYLSHHVIALGVAKNWPELGWLASFIITALLTLAVAEAIRRWVEEPCALWRRRLHRKPASPGTAPGHSPSVSP